LGVFAIVFNIIKKNMVNTVNWGRIALSVGTGLVGFVVTKRYITTNKIGQAVGLAAGGTLGYVVYTKIFK
jgi:hypothetical protein